MSSESNDTESLAQKRRNQAAAGFKQAVSKQKSKQKENAFWRMSRTMFRDVSKAFDIEQYVISSFWRDNYGPTAAELFTGSSYGSEMSRVYAYSQNMSKDGFMDLIRKGTLKDSRLWDFLVKCHKLCPDPIVLFRAGSTTWVLYPTSNAGDTQFAVPRIWVPLHNMEDKLLITAALYTKEHSHEQ